MLSLGSFDVDTPKCRILLRFIGADGGVQLFSRTSTTRPLQMSSRPFLAFLCFWSGIKTVPYCLGSDLFAACSTLIPDALVFGVAVHGLDTQDVLGGRVGSLCPPLSCLDASSFVISNDYCTLP